MTLQIPGSDARLPAYARLRDTLASRIASGEWHAAAPIPSEAKLAAEYAISVGTVRKAVDGLVSEGLLERRQGSGTFVRRPSFDATLFRFFQVRPADGAPSTIPNSDLILRARSEAPPEAARALGVRDAIRIVRLRSLADEPVLFEDIYIPAKRFSGFETLPEDALGPLLYPIYFEHFGILVRRATDDLSFGEADRQVAQRLNIAPRAPTAVIRRTAYGADGEPVEWRIAHGSAAKVRYRSEIT